MTDRKESVLVGSPLISCNHICAKMKERGLPYDSIWLMIGHVMMHLGMNNCLSDEQQVHIREMFDDYLELTHGKEQKEVERLGRDFLAELDKLKRMPLARELKEEKEFSSDLLDSVSKNLSQLFSTVAKDHTSDMLDTLKADTLEHLKNAKSRSSVLKIVEQSFVDINKQVQKTQKNMLTSMESMLVLESNALIDKLTGILNRRFFDQELPKMVQTFLDKHGRIPLTLLLLDIDRFKEINDTYGHFAGDMALQKVASIIQNNCRAGIDSPIRLGGDEFALLLIGTSEKNATKKAETIRRAISSKPMKFTINEAGMAPRKVSFTLRTSIGVCELNYDWRDAPLEKLSKATIFCDLAEDNPMYKLTCMLAESADLALYEAKYKGRDQVCVFRKVESP